VLKAYVEYFNQMRPHQGIDQRIPESMNQGTRPPFSNSFVHSHPVLGGLHHEYRYAA
jgi:putative transposase